MVRASWVGLQPYTSEYRVVLPHKGVRWLSGEAIAQALPDGSTAWYGYTTDITEQKQAEQRIRQLNRIYAVLSAINQTIVHEKEPQAMLTRVAVVVVMA